MFYLQPLAQVRAVLALLSAPARAALTDPAARGAAWGAALSAARMDAATQAAIAGRVLLSNMLLN